MGSDLNLAVIGLCMEKGFKKQQLGTLRAVIQGMQQEGQGLGQLQSISGGISEEESALSSSESSLNSIAASRAFTILG